MKPVLHPVNNAEAGIMNTFTGKQVNLKNPQPDQICLEDIAHALSMICRFGGHTDEFYSVAQHSVLVWHLTPLNTMVREASLLHDAPEAYLTDIIKPLKHVIGREYKLLEDLFFYAITKHFNFTGSFAAVKGFDKMALDIEFTYFFSRRFVDGTNKSFQPITQFEKIFGTERPCWPPDVAKEMFLFTFKETFA